MVYVDKSWSLEKSQSRAREDREKEEERQKREREIGSVLRWYRIWHLRLLHIKMAHSACQIATNNEIYRPVLFK